MALSENTRVSFGVSALISVLAGAVVCGVTWGIYSTRLDALEAQANDVSKDARELELKQARVNAQFEEIMRKLDRLERKLDWYDQRQRERDNDRH